MRITISIALVSALLISSVSSASEDGRSCESSSATQLDMNSCALSDRDRADKQLNEVYQAVLLKHKDDKTFVGKFREAQRAWVKWRDAEAEALYPEEDKQLTYGSVYPMCLSVFSKSLTAQRTKELRRWLDGTPEGDVCAGSLPISP